MVTVGAGIAVAVGPSASTSAGTLTVSRAGAGRPLPAGWLGLSLEFLALEDYAGSNPAALDQPFLQLIRNLAPRSAVVRIGGDSTDWTWWRVTGMARPGGARFTVGPHWASVAHALAISLGARLILGVNFEADSRRIAHAMAAGLLAGVGARQVAALELGNEPELYASFNWYRTRAGRGVRGRAADYGFRNYLGDYANVAAALPRVALAGPSSGAPSYLDYLGQFIASERRLGIITVHAYPLKHCGPADHPTDAQLLAPATSSALASQVGALVIVAHEHHLPLRLDEINSVSCGGYAPVTLTFGSALWALAELFELDTVGVDGVNFHTVPGKTQHLIAASHAGGHWAVSVLPEYYGLLAFAQAAPTGSRVVPVSGALAPGLAAYATLGPARAVHVALINTGARIIAVKIRLPGSSAGATLSRLSAPGLMATGSVTLGGESVDPGTGALSGQSTARALRPSAGEYAVSIPAYSAAILSTP
jgi:hypothetical protein